MSRSHRHRGTRRSGSARIMVAQFFLGFIGVMMTLAAVVAMRDAHESAKNLLENSVSALALDAKPDLRDQTLAEIAGKIRLAAGIDIAMGLLFAASAVLMFWRPVIASIAGLTLYVISLGILASIDPALLAQGLFIRVLIIISLGAAVFAAIRSERRNEARLRRLSELEK